MCSPAGIPEPLPAPPQAEPRPRDMRAPPEGPTRRHEAPPAQARCPRPRRPLAAAPGRADLPPVHAGRPGEGAEHEAHQVRPAGQAPGHSLAGMETGGGRGNSETRLCPCGGQRSRASAQGPPGTVEAPGMGAEPRAGAPEGRQEARVCPWACEFEGGSGLALMCHSGSRSTRLTPCTHPFPWQPPLPTKPERWEAA